MTPADVRTLAQKGAKVELAELKARVAELEAFITAKRKPYKTRKDKGTTRKAKRSPAYRKKLSAAMKAVWDKRRAGTAAA